MSGDGVSARSCESDAGCDDAAESGRGMGLNSFAFAFRERGEPIGDAGRLETNCTVVMSGELLGESLRAVMYEDACVCTSGEVTGVCGRRKIIASGELGAELGVSGRAMSRAE